MRHGRRTHPSPLTPRPPIKHSRHRSQQHILPVKVRRPLIPVRQAKQKSCRRQRAVPPNSPLQQILLQDIFLRRLLILIPSKPHIAALAAAVLFASAHLPNPILTPMTVIWGLVACMHFLRYRNLYPLAIAHAILGISIAITVPGPLDHNMRVGLGYLTYHHHHHLSQNDHIVSTAACVTADAPTRRP